MSHTPAPGTDDARSVPDVVASAVDYGDASLWRDDMVGVGHGAEVGWDWLGEDDLGNDRRAAFSRAADEALTTGEELLARDLTRLMRGETDPD